MSTRVQIYLLLLLLVALLGAFNFKKLSTPFKVLTGIIFITLISELIGRYLAKTIHNSNPPYPFFICLEYIGFTIIYHHLFSSRKLKQALNFSIPVFIAICCFNTILFQGLLVFPSNILLVEYMVLVFYSLLFYRQLLSFPSQGAIIKQDVFWLNTIVLVYYTADFLVRSFHNYLLRHKLNSGFIISFSYGVNLLFYIVLGYSLWLNATKKPVEWTV